MKNSILSLVLLISLNLFAQDKNATISQLNAYNDTLKILSRKLYSSQTDAEKHKWNEQMLKTFETALNQENSFNYPFDSLNDIGRLTSPDNSFRIINWNLPKADGTHEYFGFIQNKYLQKTKKNIFKTETKEIMQLYPLIDKSAEITDAESYVSDNKKWYGMLYYKIIVKKSKKNTYYTLLAWDGNDKFSSKKFIDVLTFDKNGVPKFGAPIFNMNRLHQRRVVFEYSSSCTMSLKYNSKKDSIIFDHLVPPNAQLEGQYQYYCSDLGCDGLGFKRGKWNFETDIIATNEKDGKEKLYVNPQGVAPASQSNTFNKRMKAKFKK